MRIDYLRKPMWGFKRGLSSTTGSAKRREDPDKQESREMFSSIVKIAGHLTTALSGFRQQAHNSTTTTFSQH